MSTWLRHWSLRRDPFDGGRSAFVATPGHREALARLVHTIETSGRSAQLIAPAGLGKSRVLARAIEATRSPTRRFARVAGPTDGAELFLRLAQGLGSRVDPGSSRGVAWRSLVEAARLCRWQGFQVVLVVDDCHLLATESDRTDLERLEKLDPDDATRLTVLRLGRPAETEVAEWEPRLTLVKDWGLVARLEPLTRTETANYVETKLEAAGRAVPTFTPRAITRLHLISGGVPQGIDRIANLSLIGSAYRKLEIVTPDVVDDAARECSAFEPATADFAEEQVAAERPSR